MKKEDGRTLLTEVIDKGTKHQDYKHVVELADTYYKMKTGDDITDLLKRIVTRETEEEFEQRENISKSVIPSILNSTQLPFQKAVRKQPLIREIKYNDNKKVDELEDKIAHYWGEKGLEEYLEYALIDYNYIDPNAFMITEFEGFDPNKEKAKPYPFVASSAEAIMFKYVNEILQYLIIQLPIKFMDGDTEKEGNKFTMYLGEDTLQMTEVKADYVIIEDRNTKPEVIEIKNKYYLYQEFQPKALKVPAQRFGYIRDAETKGRTFVSVFHPVILLLEKLMKCDSELDMSIAMTAFAARYMYVDKCPNPECSGGVLLDGGTTCKICGGTGHEVPAKNSADIRTFKIPRGVTEGTNTLPDLNNMLVYKTPPTEILDFNKAYINDLRILVHTAMFNNEIATRSETATAVTATEQNFGVENMNDTLFPFARNYSALYEFVVIDIATFTDLSKGLTVHHKLPTDFKFKSVTELMGELKAAKDAGASTSTISAIEDDINEILYSDRPADLKKIRVKSNINPFRGYNESDVRLLISQGKTTELNAVLWANLESIFNDLEQDDPMIYDKDEKLIIKLVKAKAQEYITQINAEKPKEPIGAFQTVNQN